MLLKVIVVVVEDDVVDATIIVDIIAFVGVTDEYIILLLLSFRM